MASVAEHVAKTVSLQVGGMTCASCQGHIQRALQEAPGVETAAVNLMMGEATVVYDAAITDPAHLVQVVEETGYEARVADSSAITFEEQDRRQQEDYLSLRRKASISLLLGVAAMVLSMPLMSSLRLNRPKRR